MKMCRIAFATLLASTAAHAEFQIAPVLNITRKAPLFDHPSKTAKLLAEADPGTPVLGRGLSPQGAWILVEDSDGNQGWMPTERTNYKNVAEIKDDILPVDPSWKTESKDLLPDTPEAAAATVSDEGASVKPRSWELSAAYREGITNDVQSVYPIGLAYLQSSGAQGVGLRADFDLGGHVLPYAWRLSFLGRYAWIGSFFRELDVGYQRQNTDPSRAGLSLGYSLGLGLSSRFAFSLRGGLFLGSEREWTGELRCRFAF
ncbi:MAG: SH3 domain-containing protein [Bdellovibrionota bacterium]